MDLVLLRAQMPALVQSHIPSNVRRFTYCILDGVPRPSSLGITFDPKPFEGKVVAKTEQAIVVKTGRAEFAVLDRSLVTRDPEEGAPRCSSSRTQGAGSTACVRIRQSNGQNEGRTAPSSFRKPWFSGLPRPSCPSRSHDAPSSPH